MDISDDMFIITAEEAKKHIEPPKLTALTIRPERPQVKPGTHMVFHVQGSDQHGRPMEVSSMTWSAKGGETDDKGGFTAGTEEGEFRIEVIVGNLRTQTTVVITKQEVLIPARPSPPDKVTGLRWSGQVPPQKWMNFYTKVLSKYATTSGLKLTVTFEVNPAAGLSPQRVEETKAALRELGLDDEIEPM